MMLNIDGVEIEAGEGTTILEAVAGIGMKPPILCHDEQLRPFASCWLCVVEVEGARGFVPACSTKVANGMKVRTKSDRITLARKMCLDLLLSNHYGDCIAPCRLECPAGLDIQGYVSLIALGHLDRAVELIMERLPMPASIGRICPHPCETACRRNLVDEPVSICSLKRFAADNSSSSRKTPKKHKPSLLSSKKVAVVGGGPSGLSAAYYLAGLGHSVTIFEAMPKLGGMLRYGIPEYRLPKKVLDSEIDYIVSSGAIDVRTGKSMGRDFSLDDLTGKMGFDAVFLAIGAWGDRSLGVDGEKSEGVISGIAFLKDVADGKPMDFSGKKVAVVGGGNTAMDAARTAVRLGALEVSIVYRRSRDEMPACKSEIAEAEHEGVKLRLLEAPKRVLSEGGRVKGLECTRMVLGEPDSSGRRKPEPVANSEFTIPLDYVIAAIGQKTAMAGHSESLKLDGRSGSLCIDKSSLQTSVSGVFGGGDAISGGGMAAEAVADGRKGALSIHRHLLSGGLSAPVIGEEELVSVSSKTDLIKPEELSDVQKAKRAIMPMIKERVNFNEVDLGFDREQATSEALRCMSCGCDDLMECALRKYAIEYGATGMEFKWGERKKYRRDIRHPFIKKEQGKCVLCGRCVRICDEVMGLDSITFARRGFDAIISTAFDGRLQDTNCVSCGQCIGTCPTGALSENFTSPDFNGLQKKSGPWWSLESKVGSICPYCGVGCAIDLHVLNGPAASHIVKVTSSGGPANPHGNLCVKGRFGFSFINRADRLRKPLVRDTKGGKFREAGWDEAISIVAKKLKMAKPPGASMFVSHRCTNEEASLADGLFASAYGPSRNTGSFFSSCAESGRQFDMEKFDRADLVIACGNLAELKRKYPVIFLRAKSARLAPAEGAEKLLEASKNPVMVFEGQEPDASRLIELFTSYGKGDCILALHEKCNSVGVGLAVGTRGEELLLDFGRTKAAYVLGEDPVGCAVDEGHKERVRSALDSLDFLVVQDMFMTETAKLADVVLPASSFAETDGTFTNSAGITQKLAKALEPPSGMENKDILMAIGSAMGLGRIAVTDSAASGRPSSAGKKTTTTTKKKFFTNGCDHVDLAFERKIRELGLSHPETEKP